MSLYEDLTEILTPYADKINQNTASLNDLRDDLDNLDVETDKTLTLEDSPADAKAVGNKIGNINSTLANRTAGVLEVVDSMSDLDVADSSGNVILRLADINRSTLLKAMSRTALTSLIYKTRIVTFSMRSTAERLRALRRHHRRNMITSML